MAATDIHWFECFEDTSPALMARVTGNSAANITQASLTAIKLYSYNKADLTTPIANNVTVVIASTVFDTLQTDDRWTEDEDGYNFRYDVPQSYLPAPGHYRFEFRFDPVSGGDFHVVFEGEVLPMASS